MSHTILLVQAHADSNSPKTYYNYRSVSDCIDGICKIYEDVLRQRCPNQLTISYDVEELFHYIDGMGDLACLVYHSGSKNYTMFKRGWIKDQIYIQLRSQADQHLGE